MRATLVKNALGDLRILLESETSEEFGFLDLMSKNGIDVVVSGNTTYTGKPRIRTLAIAPKTHHKVVDSYIPEDTDYDGDYDSE